jgi:predicted nucleotidyltransferase
VTVYFPRLDRDDIIERLENAVPDLRDQLPLRRMVLFGSQATGRATASSDIDLLVVYADPPREDAFKMVKTTIPLIGLEPHVYSESQAQRQASILERMTQDGVVIYEHDDARPTEDGE